MAHTRFLKSNWCQFCQALGQQEEVLEGLRHTLCDPQHHRAPTSAAQHQLIDALQPVRDWLDGWNSRPQISAILVQMIPPVSV